MSASEAPAKQPNADTHGHHEHPPWVAHHFDNAGHQFESGKMGIWLFLMTEILFFGGLFCWYSIYRAQNPEIFVYADQYVHTIYGAVNTIVLLISSLTAAWAVRCAQLNNSRGIALNMLLTLICAGAFMGIKSVEYGEKWPSYRELGMVLHDSANTSDYVTVRWTNNYVNPEHPVDTHAKPVEGKPYTITRYEAKDRYKYLSVYFCMTGLHGIHVLLGMVVIAWVMVRAMMGHFHSQSFGAVDYTALYWHLVDLIWIYLFPLLYLVK